MTEQEPEYFVTNQEVPIPRHIVDGMVPNPMRPNHCSSTLGVVFGQGGYVARVRCKACNAEFTLGMDDSPFFKADRGEE